MTQPNPKVVRAKPKVGRRVSLWESEQRWPNRAPKLVEPSPELVDFGPKLIEFCPTVVEVLPMSSNSNFGSIVAAIGPI